MIGPVYLLLPKFGGDFVMLDSSSFSHPQSEDILPPIGYMETNKLNQLIQKTLCIKQGQRWESIHKKYKASKYKQENTHVKERT
jgi:hypothetical protein